MLHSIPSRMTRSSWDSLMLLLTQWYKVYVKFTSLVLGLFHM